MCHVAPAAQNQQAAAVRPPVSSPEQQNAANPAAQAQDKQPGKGISDLFSADSLQKPGCCGKATAQATPAANEAQQAQAQGQEGAADPKEAIKKLLGGLGDILKKIIDQVAPGSGLGDQIKNALSGVAGASQNPVTAANAAQG